MSTVTSGILYVIATPIGNLGDISSRALETLASVDCILCEDTRVTSKLLSAKDIHVKTRSYHEHSTDTVVDRIIDELAHGAVYALVTDAGTPGISDPGNHLIARLRVSSPDTQIIPIPGPSAVITALSISGFPTDKYIFMGFPPHKKGRETYFRDVAGSRYTVVFYESSHRIHKAIAQLAQVLGADREVMICRELTKKFESVYRGTIQDIAQMNIPEKGEFVVVVKKK